MEQLLVENLKKKWEPVLNCEGMNPIRDSYRKNVTAILLENQEKALREEANVAPVPGASGFVDTQGTFDSVAGFDPVLISLVRRSMPNLIAYDVCGVQPLSGPTGLIFAMKAKFTNKSSSDNPEALFDEAPTQFSATSGGATGGSGFPTLGGTGDPLGVRTTIDGERAVGGDPTAPESTLSMKAFSGADTADLETSTFDQMAFVIDRTSVVAKTRALKAEYTSELAQDLKAIHGLDAETELANILSTEILTEINRELIRTLYFKAKTGAQQTDLTNSGIYDLNLDSDGRWSAERFRGLMFQIEREANVIAKETRRGKGNFIVTSSDVASALAMGGFLNLTPAINNQLDIDDTGNTFAGVLNGKIRVYIDPYARTNTNYVMVGYRGSNPYDAGIFYCPYVPLQMVRAVGENTFQPKIGFKTRYGMVANPFATSTDFETAGSASTGNQYYRLFAVSNLHGNTGFGL